MAGGYATHGECYKIDGNKKDIFWTYGGKIVGQAAARLKYLREIVDDLPYSEMEADPERGDGFSKFCLRKSDEVYLFFLREDCLKRSVNFGRSVTKEKQYQATVYDVWNSKICRQEVVEAGVLAIAESGWIVVRVEKRD
jgi:hypothetical protein